MSLMFNNYTYNHYYSISRLSSKAILSFNCMFLSVPIYCATDAENLVYFQMLFVNVNFFYMHFKVALCYSVMFIFFSPITNGGIKLHHQFAQLLNKSCNDLIKITYFDFHKFNRTTKALSVNFTLFEDIVLENELEIRSTLYLWKNNDYKKTPIMWAMYACSFLKQGNFAIQPLITDSSIHYCPVRKGNHYIRNLSPPNFDGWPSIIPEGKWKFHIEYYFRHTYCFTVEWVCVVTKN
ncbi:uncharacterized protein [Euwallacea fornicatus]|uniref:uncharacterized protein n=1 Tax=Euwallacea fornicatus TaxID=995702 RepID=UPI00338DE56B